MDDPHTGKPVAPAAPGTAPRPATAPMPEGAGPQRIVSLVPSVTELLAQWGLARRLVGRTRYCVEPAWIRTLVPAFGGTKDPDVPGILAQRPDLVILERDENTRETAEALRAAGVPLLVLEIRRVADCAAAWVELGRRLGVQELGQKRADGLKPLLKSVNPRKPRTVTLVWREPWIAAGPDTYLGDMVRQGGFAPVGPEGYPRLSETHIAELRPEVILLPTDPFRFNRRHQAELAKRFPEASIHILEGRALTWMLSRTEEGLALVRDLKQRLG